MASSQGTWGRLLDDAEAALRDARRTARERPAGTPEQAAAASLVTRLPEFIRDVQIAARRGRLNESAYRSVFEQLVTSQRTGA